MKFLIRLAFLRRGTLFLALGGALVWMYLFLFGNIPNSQRNGQRIVMHHSNLTNTSLMKLSFRKYETHKIKIAIGLAITSKGLTNRTNPESVRNLQIFRTLLPSFCATASFNRTYEYAFYVAYDKMDLLFKQERGIGLFIDIYNHLVADRCGSTITVKLQLIICNYEKKPAWSQNDAMMRAFIDGNDYFYRINDDTDMKSKNWTEIMIGELMKFKPPNLGVVGPQHSGGNTKILTYDFVHKTHIILFGFYYPRVFTDLYGDSWISEVYGPTRTKKLQHVKLTHTQAAGKRYSEQVKDGGGALSRKFLKHEVESDRYIIKKYLENI